MTQSHVVSWIVCSCDISTIALVQEYKELWEWCLALMRFVHPTQHDGGGNTFLLMLMSLN